MAFFWLFLAFFLFKIIQPGLILNENVETVFCLQMIRDSKFGLLFQKWECFLCAPWSFVKLISFLEVAAVEWLNKVAKLFTAKKPEPEFFRAFKEESVL